MDTKIKAKYTARANIIKAMAHPTRLFIVDKLASKKYSVGELTDMIESDMSTVSKHLNILKSSGIIADQREGTKIYYKLKMPCVLSFFGCVETVLKETGQELIQLSK